LGTAPVVVEAAALLAPGHLVPRCAWSFALDRSRLFGSCLKATYDSPLGRELLRALSAVSPTPTRIARFVIENPRHFLDAALERMPADVTPDLERARKRRTRRNLAVVGYFGYGNLGMLTAMRSSGFDGNVIVISGDPQDTLNRHGVEAVPSSDSAQVLKALAASDLLVIGGGGLLHDAGGLDFGDALERFLEGSPGLVQLSALAMLARALDMRVAIVGVGIGPLFRELAVDLAHQLLRLSGAVSVRDRGSLEWCGLWDDVSGKARLSADLAFLLDAQPAQEPHGPAIAVAPRRWFEPDMSPASSGGHWEDMADMWAQACDLVVDETGADIIFVPFQRANRNLDDLALCEEIVSKMRRGEKAHVTAHAASFAELLEQVARAQAVAAVRMHGVAAASLCGIPCVALAYDPKVEALMREIRLQEFLVAPDEASAPKVAALLSRAIKESPSLAQGLAAAREALRKRAAAAIKQLAGLLEAR
jgi:polysaccharide pyruvyl transferase CsaB